ncbi:hypothetical protein ACHAW5_008001 [Stephanodiscus triporus]|uniref:Uncharacterized protein n=1 Tax=Stephanodiscus triporus TaxID=2934178 RepID=A0ABD3NAR0_9STRA
MRRQREEEEDDDDDDVSWSIRSNACFVAGGLIHLWGASWDYVMYHDAPPDSTSPLDRSYGYYVAYQAIWILGPSVYLLNSVIDVRRVLRVRRRRDLRDGRCDYEDDREYDCGGTHGGDDGGGGGGGSESRRRRRPDIASARSSGVARTSRRRKFGHRENNKNGGGDMGNLPRAIVAALAGTTATAGRRSRRFLYRACSAVSNFLRRRSAGRGEQRTAVFGHRRALGAAATFGIAAWLSVVAAICRVCEGSSTTMSMMMMMSSSPDKDYLGEDAAPPMMSSSSTTGEEEEEGGKWWLPAVLECASVHIYLVSAILALWRWPSSSSSSWVRCRGVGRGRSCVIAAAVRSAPVVANDNDAYNDNDNDAYNDNEKNGITIPWYSDVGSLETLGDALFGISSVVDVCLQDANVDAIYWWQVASSLLWTVDALLYLRGDFVSFYGWERRLRRGSPS